jgi:HTH-type transcriptional regulator, competence development regulator
MKFEFSKDWCLRMAEVEDNEEIGAGLIAADPAFDGETVPAESIEEASVAFGRFVRLMRRSRGLSIEKLAENVTVYIAELVAIEDDARHKPDVRTVYQLANFFDVPRPNLMQIAGLVSSQNNRLIVEAARFAARSDPVAALTPEERAALQAFVAVLSERK